ncbi:MAG: glycosyltransferase [Deltaproteobacteria bacterium]|nr:MAG: glycosyltransferase [Deltaproteobacteria bacterium]
MRVAMVGLRAPWGADGGVERAVGELAPRLAQQGCRVRVVCRKRYNPHGGGLRRGVELVDVGTVYTKHLEAFVHTGAAMPRCLEDADVVHVHATGPALWSWWPRLAGKATVVTVHGLDWQRDKWGVVARAALRAGAWAAAAFPHQVIAVGRHLAAHYREHYGVDATWIPNGVSPIRHQPLSAAGIDGLRPFGFLLLLGRLVPEKGIEGLLRAYGASGIDLPLLVVGGSSYSDGYVRHLRHLAPAGVHFTGPLHGARRDALLHHARALVLPSRLEGFPLAPMESLSAGRPVLLSDIPPHRELLDGLGAGWLVPPGRDAWVDALRRVVAASEDELLHRGKTGQGYVHRHYAWERVASSTLEVYQRALALADGSVVGRWRRQPDA